MAHENKSMRLTGSLYLHRIEDGVEQSALGPLNADVLSFQSSAEIVKVPDKRRGRRGQNMKVFTDPSAPTGSLNLYSVPPRVMAMLMLGRRYALTGTGGTKTGEAIALDPDYWTDLEYQNISDLSLVQGVRATAATGVEGNDNAITWTAKAPGTGGNSISVTLVDPAANSALLSVSVDDTDITVNLATSALGAITSTAAQVMAAIEAAAAASALVTVADTGESDGSGVVAAVAETNLTGGANTGGTTYVEGDDYEVDALVGKVRSLEGSDLTGAIAAYTYAGISGDEVRNNVDYNVRARLVLNAQNDADDSRMIWEAYSVILTPNGEFDFMSAEPVQAQFSMEFETPDGKDHPARLIYVD